MSAAITRVLNPHRRIAEKRYHEHCASARSVKRTQEHKAIKDTRIFVSCNRPVGMFRILEGCRYGERQLRMNYHGQVEESGESEIFPLDPIDPALVRAANAPRMLAFIQGAGLLALTVTLCFLSEATLPMWARAEFEAPPRRWPVIGERFAGHIEALRECGILSQRRRGSAGWPIWWSSYFAVMKGVDKMRSIFNGKWLSKRCPRPPPVNLLSTHELVRKIAEVGKVRRRLYVVEGDLRHWFHQLPAPDGLQRLFGVRTTNGFYTWTTMPMGWSWSPAIAQAAAWLLILFRGPSDKELVNDENLKSTQDQLPKWIEVFEPGSRKVAGFASVYYDNVIVVTHSEEAALALKRRMEANARQDRLNLRVKGQLNYHSHEAITEKGFEYLGVHYQLIKEEQEWKLEVRPAKIQEWNKEQIPSEGLTCRQAARFVGRSLFAEMISGDSLQQTAQGKTVCGNARLVAVLVKRGGWEASVPPEPFRKMWSVTMSLQFQPHRISLVKPDSHSEPDVVLATDASDKGWGWCTFRDGKPLGVVRGGVYDANDRRHIFLKELDTALRALAECSHEKVILVVDNVAVAWALRQGFTRSSIGQTMLEQNPTALRKIGRVHTVVSADNPADSPSRGKGLEQIRIDRMNESLRRAINGGVWGSVPHTEWTAEESERMLAHCDPTEDDDTATLLELELTRG